MAMVVEKCSSRSRIAAAKVGVQGSYSLLAVSAFVPLLEQASAPAAPNLALMALLGSVSGNLMSNVVQGTRDRAVSRLSAEVKEEDVRAAVDDLIDKGLAVDAASEALGPKWDAYADQVLAEIKALGGAPKTPEVIQRIRTVYKRVQLSGGTFQAPQPGGVAVEGGLHLHVRPEDLSRLLSQLSQLQGQPESEIEPLPQRDALRVVRRAESVEITREANAAAPVPDDRRAWLERQVRDKTFERLDTTFVPLAGALDAVRLQVAIIHYQGEGPQQKRERETIPDVRQAFERYPCFALLGDPGGGKTTVLQRLALEGYRAALQDETRRVPLYVRLSLHRQGDPAAFLAAEWRRQGHERALGRTWEQALAAESVLLLADGLNKMPRALLTKQMDAWGTWVEDGSRILPGDWVGVLA
jgi:hypothetical protein